MFLWVDLDHFLSLILLMTHCGLLRASMSFHRTTVLGRYLSTICLWTLRDFLLYMVCVQLRRINTLMLLGSKKRILPTYVLSSVLSRTFSNHLWLYCSKCEPSISSELRLHCHLSRARCQMVHQGNRGHRVSFPFFHYSDPCGVSGVQQRNLEA